MEFKFKDKKNNIKLGDVLISNISGCRYLIVSENTSSSYKYKLLRLDDSTIISGSFDSINNLMDHHFKGEGYKVIPREDLVLSN